LDPPFCVHTLLHMQFPYAVRLPNVGFGKQPALVAEPDRPVSCCMAVLTDAPGRRTPLHVGLFHPLLDCRPRDLRPLVERHLIMIKELVFIGRSRRPSSSHVACSSGGTSTVSPIARGDTRARSQVVQQASTPANTHSNGRLHLKGYPQAHRQAGSPIADCAPGFVPLSYGLVSPVGVSVVGMGRTDHVHVPGEIATEER
jgi:hypothetical protein